MQPEKAIELPPSARALRSDLLPTLRREAQALLQQEPDFILRTYQDLVLSRRLREIEFEAHLTTFQNSLPLNATIQEKLFLEVRIDMFAAELKRRELAVPDSQP